MSSIFLGTNIFFNLIVVEEFMIIALLEKTEQQKLYHFMASIDQTITELPNRKTEQSTETSVEKFVFVVTVSNYFSSYPI